MQNEDRHDPAKPFPSGSRSTQPDAPEQGPPEDFLRMMKWIRQAQSDAHRLELAEEESTDLKDKTSGS